MADDLPFVMALIAIILVIGSIILLWDWWKNDYGRRNGKNL